jgi:formylglycine-generating enzyme required for sulfatase activity
MPQPIELVDDKGVSIRLVPAVEFIMGSDTDSDDRNRRHLVYVEAFYMDRYEVTNLLFAACVTAGVCALPHFSKSDFRDRYFGIPEYESFPLPVLYRSWLGLGYSESEIGFSCARTP